MTSDWYEKLFMPLWNPILHQLYKMANHELPHLRSMHLFVYSDQADHFLYKRVENTHNEFATSYSNPGQWIETKRECLNSFWRSDWFED